MQDEVNQDYSEQNEVDGMKKGADLAICGVEISWSHRLEYLENNFIAD